MITCTKCNGQGLIGGNPDRPADLVGAKKTCPDCKGTGKVEENVESDEPTLPEVAPEEKTKAQGFLSRILKSK